MSDFSKRFEALMARMAHTDAQLFRTIGEQNAALHRIAEDMEPDATPPALTDQGGRPSVAALTAASLLPREQCNLKQLKKRFRTLPPARAFLEERLGPPPKGTGRITWKVVEQTVTTGQWPTGKTSDHVPLLPGAGVRVETGQWPVGKTSSPRTRSRGEDLAAMEQRLQARLERLEQRLERLELLLVQVLEHQLGPATKPPP